MMGANKSLLTLRLDNNPFIAGEGIMDLCLGLRTNKTLKVRRALTGICMFVACYCEIMWHECPRDIAGGLYLWVFRRCHALPP
jgi:hypothetical protein